MVPADERYAELLGMYRSRVEGYIDVDDDFTDRWRAWCRRLLGHGGQLVVPPRCPEPDLDALLADAVSFGAQHDRVAGQDNDCHANVAALWAKGEVPAIGTGYALSEDGLWRQHSWGLRDDNGVVETTFGRVMYVGLRLPDGPASLVFAFSNAFEQVNTVLAEGGARAAELSEIMNVGPHG